MLYLLGLIFIIVYTFPSIILAYLQLKHISFSMKKSPVILSQTDYLDAGKYAIKKLKLSMLESVVEAIVFLIWICCGLSLLETKLSYWHVPQNLHFVLYVLAFLMIGFIISIPNAIYTTMYLDKEFGFSKSTWGLFIKDVIKNFLMLMIIGGIIIFLLILIMHYTRYWWLYGFCLIFILAILANALYPTLIAPIFNKFTPLQDESLKEKIELMMEKVGFKSNGIFVMDASKRDGRLNAYFGGIGKSKRVVLFDTLLQKVSQEGLLAILGHELGHFKHKDILKNLVLMAIILFVLFFIAGNLPKVIFESLSIEKNPSNVIIFLLLISPVISFLAMPLIGYFSRKAEYKADEYGAFLTTKHSLAEALVRLVNENKAFPCSHPAYIFFYYTHPPLLQRLKALDYQWMGE